MNTKAFVLLLVGVLLLGGSIGGAFAGGIALGKSQGEDVAEGDLAVESTLSLGQQPSGQQTLGQAGQEQMAELRERIRSGQISEEDMAQMREQFLGPVGQDFAMRGGLTGAIEEIEGGTITVNTSQGPLQAIVGEDTTIQKFAEVTLSDLLEGMQVTVIGQPGEDGAVEAVSIVVIPEGAGGFMGGGFPGGHPSSGP